MSDFDDFTVFNADVLRSLNVNEAAITAMRAGVEEGVHIEASALDGRLMLIGLMADETNIAVRTARQLGETPERIRFAARGLTHAPPFNEPPHLTSDTPLPIADEVRQMLRLAVDEAQRLGPWKAVGPEHLLLAMTRDDGQSVNPLLKAMGLTLERTRRAVRSVLGFPT